ncbi:phage/plasmid primase, P4 family [Rhodomicrobium vannielii ATCC 17100]|uniref:Phage/plasmid primase, P4 family n=1 Tax=Rhodomicrobium vannielii (strain ATCC 17100 / DSM 162 / LMG 4299 / NCIMB 10020 / ATH 3.1.1) TaxID=648757 RepID=E3I866_RHOVT|nr:phage/plasmid primase, P4 family [Rhodomicrobium vannielii]ADP71992.1 phage/plasmid primase, P4 family [Rhodomicrobium vannielii ATCC 17100]
MAKIYDDFAEDSRASAKKSLNDLAGMRRWVAWRLEDGRKVPKDARTGGNARSNDSSSWATQREARAWWSRNRTVEALIGDPRSGGIGVMLGDLGDGHLWCIDLDGCLGNDGAAPHAADVVKRFGSYCEVSPSGRGLKLFFLISDTDVAALGVTAGKAFAGPGAHSEMKLMVRGWSTLTEKAYSRGALREIDAGAVRWFIDVAGPAYQKQMKGGGERPRDESGSGQLFRLAKLAHDLEWLKEEFEDVIADHPDAAAHVAKEGQRALDRAWDNAAKPFEPTHEDEPAGFDQDSVIRAFTKAYAGELLFDHHAGKWFRFDGYWRREETKLALHYAREQSLKIASSEAKTLKTVPTWEAIERGARSVREFAVTSDVWNRDTMLLGTPNGTVDLRTGELRDARPEDRISRVTAVAPIPHDEFRAKRDCPRWLAFLDEALAGDAGAIRFLQQWCGYSLTGETREQKLVFVYGPGGSGKGTAINTVGDILGDYAVNVGMETLTASKYERHTTELARLRGARMARASETEKGKAWAENRIKNLTGQDTITARFMRQDDFEFAPEFKLTIFGNNRPSLRDVDAAIKRRFLILPFDHPPRRPNTKLADALKREWPGILAWLIDGCLDWQESGLIVPPVMDAATKEYFAAEDTFAQWLADRCDVGPEFVDTSDNLWDSWSRYAYGLGEEPGTKKGTFAETLSQRGFFKRDQIGRDRKRGYRGLRVRKNKGDLAALDD